MKVRATSQEQVLRLDLGHARTHARTRVGRGEEDGSSPVRASPEGPDNHNEVVCHRPTTQGPRYVAAGRTEGASSHALRLTYRILGSMWWPALFVREEEEDNMRTSARASAPERSEVSDLITDFLSDLETRLSSFPPPPHLPLGDLNLRVLTLTMSSLGCPSELSI